MTEIFRNRLLMVEILVKDKLRPFEAMASTVPNDTGTKKARMVTVSNQGTFWMSIVVNVRQTVLEGNGSNADKQMPAGISTGCYLHPAELHQVNLNFQRFGCWVI